MAEQQYPKGIYFNIPRENAPDFVIGSIALNLAGIDRDQLNAKKNEKWYVYLDVKRGKDGKPYVSFNTYKPEGKKSTKTVEDLDFDSIPF